LATGTAASGRYAGLPWIVLFDGADGGTTGLQRLENGARTNPSLHRSVRDDEPPCRRSEIRRRLQSGMRQMDVGKTVVADAPRFAGALDISKH
jgi:hypothetical protein